MKARIKATDEVVDIISYKEIYTTGILQYLVSYVDSKGIKYAKEGTDYHLDFESVDTLKSWQDVREMAAIAAMQGTIGILSSNDRYAFRDIVVEGYSGTEKTYPKEIAEFAVACADALVEQLKKKE